MAECLRKRAAQHTYVYYRRMRARSHGVTSKILSRCQGHFGWLRISGLWKHAELMQQGRRVEVDGLLADKPVSSISVRHACSRLL